MLRAFFPFGIYLPIVFPIIVSVVRFHVTVLLLMVLLFVYSALLILTSILHRNSLILHNGSAQSHSVPFNLSPTCVTKLFQKRCTFRFVSWHLNLSILIIPFLNRNLFLPMIVLMTGLACHIKTSIISITSNHLNLLKSCHCIEYVIWFLYTLPYCLHRLSVS